jgi:predicted TIM-barrel fold metal-dependent hydrolase
MSLSGNRKRATRDPVRWYLAPVLLWSAFACAAVATPERYGDEDFALLDKIDAHVHLHGLLPEFMKRAQADGFRLLTINVNYADFPPLDAQVRDALALQRQHPSRIAFAATFDAAGSDAPDWPARTQRQLDDALAQGAVAVKVWKDIGMQLRDRTGRAVMIDDARFVPVFESLVARGVVVLGHQGEPRNAWLPLDQMTIRGDREYFAAHPQYHMFRHPEWPSYDEQLAARDHLLERFPRMKFVGVHLASLEWDVDRIAEFLTRHPQASVDLAARLVHLQLQSVADRDKVRRFFLAFQDRILYGSDLAGGHNQDDDALAVEAHEAWLADWQFLTGDAFLDSADFEGRFQGLALPRTVIDRIYRDNARRLLPGAWPPTSTAGRGPAAARPGTEP